jgi:membrane fusion protein (multidrug efflux system)
MAEANPETTVQDSSDAPQEGNSSARKTWLIRLGLAVIVVGVLWGVWYLLVGRTHVATDNAYVNAEMAQVTPLVSAQATEVLVSDTQTVKRGDILVKLDPTDAKIAVAQAQADLAEAKRRFRQTSATSTSLAAQVDARGADIVQARAQLATAQADLEKARVDLQRREALVGDGAVSGDEVTSARKGYASARAALDLARAGVQTAQATRSAASGQLEANDALVRGSSTPTRR